MKGIIFQKKVNRSAGGTVAIMIFLLAYGAFMVLPFIFAVVNAFKPVDELFLFPPRFFVRRPTLENFIMLGEHTSNLWVPFSRYVFNSLLITVVTTVLQILIACMGAYPLSKHKFPGHKFLFGMIVMSLLFTNEAIGVASFIVITSLKLTNTYWVFILPGLASSFALYLMRQNMLSISDSILESARIDGASEYKTLWSIVVPNVKAAWLTLVIFAVQGMWAQGNNPFVYNESLKTINAALTQIVASGIARQGVGAAIGVIMMLPPLITYVVTQSNVIEAMANSGLKE